MTTVFEALSLRCLRPWLRLVALAVLLAPAPARGDCGHYVLFGEARRPAAPSAGKTNPHPRAPAHGPAAPCRGPSCSRQTPGPPAPPSAPATHLSKDSPCLGAAQPAPGLSPSPDRPAEVKVSLPEGFALAVYHPPR
jgi:hypothetical protein